MSSSPTPPQSASADLESIETRMRRALDLVGGSAGSERPQGEAPKPDGRSIGQPIAVRPRQRFALDGATPFETARRHRQIDNRTTDRAPAVNPDGERSLQEALATIHDLQTKLGHADLRAQEMAGTLQAERTKSEALQAGMLEQVNALEKRLAAEQASRAAVEASLLNLQATLPDHNAEAPVPVSAPVKVKAPRKAAAPKQREPQPVKWWIKKPAKR
jgi:hypothetical protein